MGGRAPGSRRGALGVALSVAAAAALTFSQATRTWWTAARLRREPPPASPLPGARVHSG